MIPMLRLQFIIFALIGVGFFTRKKGMVSREGQKNITDLVIHIVLPCNIVTSFVQELPDSALRDCATVFLISVGMEVMCMAYAKFAYRNVEEKKRKCLTYGILVSNAGFLGNPVAEGVYGPMGLMLASVYLIPVRVMMWSRGIALFSGQPVADDRAVQHGPVHDGDRHDPVGHRPVTAHRSPGASLHSRAAAHRAGHPRSDPFCSVQMRAGLGALPPAVCTTRSHARRRDDEHALLQI